MARNVMSRLVAAWAVMAGSALLVSGCDKAQGSGASTATPPPASAKGEMGFPARPSVSNSDVVARVNRHAISRRDVELVVQNLKSAVEASGQAWQPLSQEDMQELLQGLVQAELKLQDGVARGIDRDPEVQRRMLLLARNFYAQEWDRHQVDSVQITDEEVRQFYETNPWYFQQPARIRVRQMMFASEGEAKSALVQMLEGTPAEALAHSTVQPEAVDGQVTEQWVMRSGEKALYAPEDPAVRDLADPTLEQAAFAIDKIEGISSYVRGTDGHYHIFQLIAKEGGEQQSFEDAAATIRLLLQRQKLDARIEQIAKDGKVESFPEKLGEIQQ